MKVKYSIFIAALMLVLSTSIAEARGKGGGGKGGGKGGSSSGTPTNYGCQTFGAGTAFGSPDGQGENVLTAATYTCYLCNLTARSCVVQSPSSMYGWTFVY